MASGIGPCPLTAALLKFQVSERLSTKNHSHFINPNGADKKASYFPCRATQSENLAEEQSATASSTRSQLDLLQQLTSSAIKAPGNQTASDSRKPTIREQLVQLTRGREEDNFTLQLGKKMKESLKRLKILTVSQRRNIKRQTYLNEVGRRNDAAFFATIGAFVILPPLIILAAAVQTGYVQFLP